MCGIIGEICKEGNKVDIGIRAKRLLRNLQHRGHESAGITVTDGQNVSTKKGTGEVIEAIPKRWAFRKEGLAAIGQVRYSTTGSSVPKDNRAISLSESEVSYEELHEHEKSPGAKSSQPFFHDSTFQGRCALVHNGNLTNASSLKSSLIEKGIDFEGSSDSEVILKLLCYLIDAEKLEVLEAIQKTMTKIKGAFSCIFLTKKGLWVFRDKKGFRPLKVAETKDSFIFASEDCAWHNRQAKFLRDVMPGEIIEVRIGKKDLIFHKPPEKKHRLAVCVFEYIYLMAFYSWGVAKIRTLLGKRLFHHHPFPGIVIPVMTSGEGGALGYHMAQSQEFPGRSFYFPALYKNPLVGRTFLEPKQIERIHKNRSKYFFLFDAIRESIYELAKTEKKIFITLIDDSLIRGNVSRTIIKLVRAELKKLCPDIYKKIRIIWLLTSPPYKSPCYFGIDTYEKKELIAANRDIEGIRKSINASYVGYLPLEDMLEIAAEVLEIELSDFCEACFSGNYPIPIDPEQIKMSLK